MTKIFVPYSIDEDGEKHFEIHALIEFVGERFGFDDGLVRSEDDMLSGVYNLYGLWLIENGINDYRIRTSCVNTKGYTDERMYTLKTYIDFDNEEDLMAFKLRWE